MATGPLLVVGAVGELTLATFLMAVTVGGVAYVGVLWFERVPLALSAFSSLLPAGRRRSGAVQPARCCCGVTPRTRLNAALSAKPEPYPTWCATAAPASRPITASTKSSSTRPSARSGTPCAAGRPPRSAARPAHQPRVRMTG